MHANSLAPTFAIARTLKTVWLYYSCQLSLCYFNTVAESGRRTLRSAERSVCVIQRCNNTFGDRSFAVAGPRAWNDLPVTLRNTELTMDTFCKHLKTVLFTDSRGSGAFVTFWFYCAIHKCSYLLTVDIPKSYPVYMLVVIYFLDTDHIIYSISTLL